MDVTITEAGLTLVFATHASVAAGTTHSYGPGVLCKAGFSGFQYTVSGSLQMRGTPEDPVVFTSFADDEWGGDTNGDGPSSGVPAGWRGFVFSAGAEASSLADLLLRYPGTNSYAGIDGNSPLLLLRSVRVEHGAGPGFALSALSGEARQLVAHECVEDGIRLEGGSFDLDLCTVQGCDRYGIARTGAWTGSVSNSIAWGSGTANYDGFTGGGDLVWSDGSVALSGMDGNIDQDPLFIDEANGDLGLTAVSPLVDGGDPLHLPGGRDAAGFPRTLDGDLDLGRRVDMGAYEFDNVRLAIGGDVTPGGVITLTSTGTAGLVSYLFAGLGELEVNFGRFGGLFVDVTGVWALLDWAPVPSSIPLPLPNDLPVGLTLVIQQLGITAVPDGAGNLSNPVTLVLE